MIRRRRAAGRAPHWLALALLSCGPGPPEGAAPLAAPLGVQRLGPHGGYAKLSGEVRPVLSRVPGPLRVALGDLPSGRLRVAAAFAARPEGAAGEASCRLTLEGEGAPALAVRLAPPESPGWVEARVELPGLEGARLAVDCQGGARATWARPLWLPEAPPAPPPLIALLSLDTLRADHVTGFGGERALTPHLERLGREGVRLAAAGAEGSWTVPSHFALFHSRIFGYPVEDPPLVSLTESLAGAGFVTLGLTGGGFMGSAWRFNRGFDRYVEYGAYADSLGGVLADALDEIRRFAGAPLFLYLHSYAVHRQTPEEMEWLAEHGFGRDFEPDAALLARARARYAELVREADADLAPFLEALARIAQDRPTLLVLVSDHGEAFREHGGFRHGSGGPPRITLHDELVHVPLLAWAPGLIPPGRILRRAVGLVDVAPSLLSAAGVPAAPGMRGRDQWPVWSGAQPEPPGPGAAVSEARATWSLREDDRKLIVARRDGGSLDFQLFDLARDPGEQVNLAARQPAVVRALLARLRRERERLGATRDFSDCPLCRVGEQDAYWRQALAGAEARGPVLDGETRRRLRELGYGESD